MNTLDSARNFEICMARLYTDAEFRKVFTETPELALKEYGLEDTELQALLNIDRVGLELAAYSFQAKRDSYLQKKKSRKPRSWVFRASRWLKRTTLR